MTENDRAFRPGEVLLAYFQHKPAFFLRVEQITPDRKKGWWQLEFIVLALPLQKAVWILDTDQLRGQEFTMQGHPIRLERVVAPAEQQSETTHPQPGADSESGEATVVSLFDNPED
ncbi:hypothetical protein JW992_03350 [candidate division KSB1 bacterium]|nr:hypothetical protein [candidate division KSB1 bacterium]